MNTDRKQISPERKATYYLGMSLMIIGILLFLSPLLTVALLSSKSGNFMEQVESSFSRAVIGMIVAIIGGVLQAIGSSGLAGSGIVLDPEQVREDLEPWNRAQGGMIQDALSEIELVKKVESKIADDSQVVKIRCQKCKWLNDETAKFCNQCGAEM